MSDPQTHRAPAIVNKFEFDRIPESDAELVMDVIRKGCHAQLTDTGRRNLIGRLQAELETYRKDMWP